MNCVMLTKLNEILTKATFFALVGITGSVSIDKNGDRRIDYQLYHYGDGTFYPAINYNSLLDSIDFLSTVSCNFNNLVGRRSIFCHRFHTYESTL